MGSEALGILEFVNKIEKGVDRRLGGYIYI